MPHLIDLRPLDLVIPWVGSRLVDDISRRTTELHPLAFETNVADACGVLIAIAKVLGEEERDASDGVEARSALYG